MKKVIEIFQFDERHYPRFQLGKEYQISRDSRVNIFASMVSRLSPRTNVFKNWDFEGGMHYFSKCMKVWSVTLLFCARVSKRIGILCRLLFTIVTLTILVLPC